MTQFDGRAALISEDSPISSKDESVVIALEAAQPVVSIAQGPAPAEPVYSREGLLAQGVYGWPARIGGRVFLESPANIENVVLGGENHVGAYSYFNVQCEMYNASLGRYCSIGQQVIINPGEHPIEFLTTHPVASDSSGVSVGTMGGSAGYQAIACTAVTAPRREQKPVIIGHDVWVGARAIITSGVTIGHGAVIGANSLVREDVEPYTIVAGSPARVIRRRFDEALVERLLESEWWNYDLRRFSQRDYSDIPGFLDQLDAARASGEAEMRRFPVARIENGQVQITRRSRIAFDGQGDSLYQDDVWPLTWQIDQLLRDAHPNAKVIDLIAPTGSDLVQSWQACLVAGREPIILHYPTAKLSRVYWQEEMASALATVGVDLLICADAACRPETDLPVIQLDQVTRVAPPADAAPNSRIPETGAIIQMSSGTTGHRKGIRFDLGNVRLHARRYKETLKATDADTVVSWLPLYHDMGFIATFVMPRLLDCDLILIDPMAWIKTPAMLWDALERHRGTLVYMPNFAFEVMARAPRPAPGVRLWISCSEPTRPDTLRRFSKATGTPLSKLRNAWGMAENIFAVTHAEDFKTRDFDGVEVVSAGPPITGVTVKSVDGRLWVKSEYSLTSYMKQDIDLNAEGFYNSGDVGEVVDGEVYLLGRTADLINNAGRKTLLTDLDHQIATAVPESAGRIAVFAEYDDQLGTDIPVALIEHPQFWRKNRDGDLIRRVIDASGVESLRVHFVPQRFITKTSSGKINRMATREDWRQRARQPVSGGGDLRAEISEMFPWIDFVRPVGEQIDSLGFVNLNLLCARHGRAEPMDPERSVNAQLEKPKTASATSRLFKVVTLCDANPLRGLGDAAFRALTGRKDATVQIKHVCAPPPAVLLSDLIFAEYFLSRDVSAADDAYRPVLTALNELREASLIIIDDASVLFWPTQAMVYPKISHDFQRNPLASQLAVRWAGYSENHHKLSLDLVEGRHLTPDTVNENLEQLSDYLGVPIVRVAYADDNPAVTANWEVHGHASSAEKVAAQGLTNEIDQKRFTKDLQNAVNKALETAPSREVPASPFINFNDQAHWCGWLINKDLVDFILDNYRDILVLGRRSSAPYLAEEAARRGMTLTYRLDMKVPDEFDCVVQNGSWGQPETDKPVFQIMGAGWANEPVTNVSAEVAAQCPTNRLWTVPTLG